jgi:hypothetical protein
MVVASYWHLCDGQKPPIALYTRGHRFLSMWVLTVA